MSELDKGQYIDEQHVEQSTQKYRDARIAIHNDTYDIDGDALGTNRPKRYYLSPGFIGTVVVRFVPTSVPKKAYRLWPIPY